MNEHFVECRLCNRELKRVSNFHLKFRHNLTIIEYKNMFPYCDTYSKDTLEKMSQARQLVWKSKTEEEKQWSIARMLSNHFKATNEMREKWSKAAKEQWRNPISREKINAATHSGAATQKRSLARTGCRHTPEAKAKIREAALQQWRHPIKRQRIIKALLEMRSPNKLEQKLLSILSIAYPNEWKFVGDGQLIIAGRCPDFVNVNGKKLIIELFGECWHKPSDELIKKRLFAKYGYGTLVIWSKELYNKSVLLQKIEHWLDTEAKEKRLMLRSI